MNICSASDESSCSGNSRWGGHQAFASVIGYGDARFPIAIRPSLVTQVAGTASPPGQ